MSDIKWVKISTDILDDEKIQFIEGMPEGDTLFNIWVKLIILAGRCNANGYLYVAPGVPYNEESLATRFHKPQNIIRLALATYLKLEMIFNDNGAILLANFGKHQNIEGLEKIREQTRLRTQQYRLRLKDQKLITSGDVTVTSRDATEVEVEIEGRGEDRNPTTTTRENENFGKIYEENIGQLTPLIADELRDIEKTYPSGWFTEAVKEACDNNKRNLRYIIAILERWVIEGFKSPRKNNNYNNNNHKPEQTKPKSKYKYAN